MDYSRDGYPYRPRFPEWVDMVEDIANGNKYPVTVSVWKDTMVHSDALETITQIVLNSHDDDDCAGV